MEKNKEQKYNLLFEQMIDCMTNPNGFDREDFVEILKEICELFNLSKGVTEFYKSLSAEKDGQGEIMVDYDNGKGDKVVIYRRIVTPSMTVVKSTIYMAADSEPLSDDEYRKVDIILRAMLSFISRNRLQTVVENLGYYDESGYPNLSYYMRYLDQMNEKDCIRGNVAVYYNLRHFSLINQEIGRIAADKVMRSYFETVKAVIGNNGLVCRVGGDNFVLFCSKEILRSVLFILDGFPVTYDTENEKRVMISAYAGVFVIPDDFVYERPGEIVGRIIASGQDAKSERSGTVVYYSEKSIAEKEKLMRIRVDFSEGIKKGEFQAYYQPKVDINSGRIVGAEALCRWVKNGKIVPPIEFIPILEQNTDICQLDYYMLDAVCKDIRRWLNEKKQIVRVSVNLSRKNLIDIDLLEQLIKIIDKNKVPHRYIEIELTETTTDAEFLNIKRVVNGLRKEGIYTTVDDFGMGYSSLNLIREIPWDVLKLDRNFIPSEENFGVTELMFRHVVAMAQAMGLECVAEGVETMQQIELLRENDCRIAQGFYFDKPLPAAEFEKRLAAGKYDNI